MTSEATIEWTGAALLDAAVVQRTDGDLLVLDSAGGISCIDLDSGAVTLLGTVELPEMTVDRPIAFGLVARWRMHASADGAFVAIVFDGGSCGFVVDLSKFSTTMQLDGGSYHEETVPFSICFVSVNGRVLLIHRTAWNRLDISDPESGALLTERGPTDYQEGERPPHYSDYFHGRLHPNRSGTCLLDDGWIWQPVSAPCVFNVADWLTKNVWESEDGPSIQTLVHQDDWNGPACWIDDDHVVLEGMNDWDSDEFASVAAPPGVRIVDIRQKGAAIHRKLPMTVKAQELFTDGDSLFAVHGQDTSVWSLATGDCTKQHVGFAASHIHKRRQQLLEVKPHRIRRLSVA